MNMLAFLNTANTASVHNRLIKQADKFSIGSKESSRNVVDIKDDR